MRTFAMKELAMEEEHGMKIPTWTQTLEMSQHHEELASEPPDPYPSSTDSYYGYSSMDDESDEEPTPWVVKPKPVVHTQRIPWSCTSHTTFQATYKTKKQVNLQ